MLHNKIICLSIIFCVMPLFAMHNDAEKPPLRITLREISALEKGYGNNRILIHETPNLRRYSALLSNGDCLVAERFADGKYTYKRCKNGWHSDVSDNKGYFDLLERIYCAKNYRV